MEVAGKSYPMRAFIRHKAKEQLRQELDTLVPSEPLDEALFLELAATTFRAEKNQTFHRPCLLREEAAEIENRIAAELVEAYRWIKSRQKSSIVQKLNTLL
jgi:hypothetical protein